MQPTWAMQHSIANLVQKVTHAANVGHAAEHSQFAWWWEPQITNLGCAAECIQFSAKRLPMQPI